MGDAKGFEGRACKHMTKSERESKSYCPYERGNPAMCLVR